MSLRQNIDIYCALRSKQFNDYCTQNGLQVDPAIKQIFFETEMEKVNGKPNPVFVETMKYVSAFVSPIQNKANLYSIVRGQAYKDFLTQKGAEDTPESRSSFISFDMVNKNGPNPEFLTAMSYVELMSETKSKVVSELFSSVKNKEYQEFLTANKMSDGIYSKARFFVQNSDASNQPNSDFRKTMQAVVVLRDNFLIASKYTQARQEQYNSFIAENGLENNPESIARFFVKEREIDGKPNPVFKEVMSKIFPQDQEEIKAYTSSEAQTQKVEEVIPAHDIKTEQSQVNIKPEKVVEQTSETVQENATIETQEPQIVISPEEQTNIEVSKVENANLSNQANTITPRQDFKNMPINQLTAYVRVGINDNGPHKTRFLEGGLGDITEEVIPAAMEYLSRSGLESIELKNLNGINLNITRESSLEELAGEWTSKFEAAKAARMAAKEAQKHETESFNVVSEQVEQVAQLQEDSPSFPISETTETAVQVQDTKPSVVISEEMRAKFGNSYDLDAIAKEPNATEVLKDLPAFDSLAKGQQMNQQQSLTTDPTFIQTISTTNN